MHEVFTNVFSKYLNDLNVENSSSGAYVTVVPAD
jgi:hypothetical protein